MRAAGAAAGLAVLLLARAAGASPDSTAVARVGDYPIDRATFEEGFARAPRDTAKTLVRARHDFLESLIHRRLLVLAAREAGLFGPDSLRESRLESYEETMLVEKVRELDIRSRLEVTDADVDTMYARQAVAYDMSQIMTVTREEAEAVLGRLAAGEDFAALAEEVSIDAKTIGKGGRIPPFVWGSASLKFLRELEAMQPGEVRGPIQSETGFHVIKLNGLIPRENRRPLSEEREFLAGRCRIFKEMEAQDAYYAELQRRYHFTPNWPALHELSRRFKAALQAAAESKQGGATLDEQAGAAMRSIVLPESLLAQPVATWDFGRYLMREEWDFVSGMPGLALVDRRNPYHSLGDAASEFNRAAMAHEGRRRGLEWDPDIRRRLEQKREEAVVTQFYRTAILDQAIFTEAEEREYFAAHPEQFILPRQFRGARIQYLAPEPSAEMEACLRAPVCNPDSLMSVHLAKGVVRAQDRQGAWFVEAERPILFERASTMKPDDVARVVDEDGYWTVFVLIERQEEKKLGFEEARKTVQKSLRNLRSEEILKGVLTKLKQKHPVWVDEAFLARTGGGG